MTLVVQRLRSQLPDGVLAFGAEQPRLSWQVSASHPELVQLGYEIEASESPGFESVLATTDQRDGDAQVAVPAPGGPLRSREVRHYRVRVRDVSGWSGWSDGLRIEAGLLEPGAWSARAITIPDDPGSDRQSPSPVLRREFDVAAPIASARLHVTAFGVHQVSLNGRLVSDDLLAPGWTSYGQRMLADTYDVTRLLTAGRNAIGAVLGDGWYRGRLGWDAADDRCRYGRELGLVAQLEIECVDGTRLVVSSDRGWRASTAEIRAADFYDGSTIDLRVVQPGWDAPGFDDSSWIAATSVPFDPSLIEPRSAPPVRRIAVLPVRITRAGEACWRLDGGQNISGWVRLTVRGVRDDRVVVRHAEVLEPDGGLHTRSLRSAKATDEYILAGDDAVVLEPAFTFHGFRYAEVETSADVLDAQFIAISSDTAPRASFECSDADLTRFHENVVWSQRDNFVSIPTDCPQRDERLGWTGDAQAFAATGSTLFDSAAFWMSWLRDLELDQDSELGVPSVVPDVVLSGELRFGRAGWADAATIVPWAVYESYGDPAVLERQFASMRGWVDSLSRRRGPDGLLVPGTQFGDWLDPDAPVARPWEAKSGFGLPGERLLRAQRPARGRRCRSPGGPISSGDLQLAWPRDRCRDVEPLVRRGPRVADRLRRRTAAGRCARRRTRSRRLGARGAGPRCGRACRQRVPGDAARAARAQRVRVYRRVLPDAPSARVAVVALPGSTGRHDGLGTLGCDPPRRLDPPRHDDDAPGPSRFGRSAHAQLQPLRVRRRGGLGVPARGGDRP
jgi:alpha-L-rhamnosidase